MRVFWAYALSGMLHLGGIAALALWLPPMPQVEIRLRRGDSVVLSAAFSQPAAPEAETPTATIVPPEEIEPAPPLTREAPAVEAVEMTAPPVEVERSEHEVEIAVRPVEDRPPEQPAATEGSRSRQPAHEPLPEPAADDSPRPPQRKVAVAMPRPVGELAEASPFQAATELGSEVDQLPSQFPNNRKPEYPADALLAGIEGVVNLRVLIDKTGRVTQVQLERSSGTPSLDQSAIRGVRQWRFSPARRGGFAVSYEVIVPVRFSIRG